MGQWKPVSRAGAKKAAAEGLDVRLTASGHQLWVSDEAEQAVAEEQDSLMPEAASLLDVPVHDLASALEEVDDYVVVKAAARDKRKSARPIYRARLGGDEAEE